MSRRRGDRRGRGPWFLITGLVLGLFIGVGYSWLVSPAEYVDTAPVSLREDFKDHYRLMIALAYDANQDLARAQARLALLEDPDPAEALSAQAQRALADGRSDLEVRALASLAQVAAAAPANIPTAVPLTEFPTATASLTATSTPTLTASPTATITPTATLTPTVTLMPTATLSVTVPVSLTLTVEVTPTLTATPRPTRTPTPTATPRPSATPTATPGNPFVLDQRSLVCEKGRVGPLLILQAYDIDGRGVPGIEAVVTWSQGEERFFTGLKPELGLGYADFVMTPGIVYSFRLASGSQIVADLTAAECETDEGERIWGSWELIFIQP